MTLVDPETGEVMRLNVHQARWSGNVHPAADRFRRMTSSEFETLKRDIEVNGQLDPIWLEGSAGDLIDGRHRMRVCEELGIEPWFAIYHGHDIEGFIDSKNLQRRHLSKQEAATQRKRTVAEKHAEGKSTRTIADEVGVSNATVARDLDEVLHDVTPADAAAPETVVGKDGKTYAARKAKTVWTEQQARDFLERVDALTGPASRDELAADYGITAESIPGTISTLRKRFNIAGTDKKQFTAMRRDAHVVLNRMCEQIVGLGLLVEEAPLHAADAETADRWTGDLRIAMSALRGFVKEVSHKPVQRKRDQQ